MLSGQTKRLNAGFDLLLFILRFHPCANEYVRKELSFVGR
jgi:hypothetical protein